MKSFLQTTQDKIEQLYAREILIYFPYYGEFWEKFIGLRSGSRLLPYRLQVPTTMTNGSQILRSHEELSMRHYSQFCQLAGAHFQLAKAIQALEDKDEALRHFSFWEAFDNFYQHLANARNQMYGLWAVVYSLNPSLPEKIKEYLEATERNSLSCKIHKWEDEAETLRDNLVHFSRGAVPYGDGAYWIPVPIRKNVAWSEMLINMNRRPFQEATKKMANDLHELESILDEVQRLIGEELRKSFQSMGVVICYG